MNKKQTIVVFDQTSKVAGVLASTLNADSYQILHYQHDGYGEMKDLVDKYASGNTLISLIILTDNLGTSALGLFKILCEQLYLPNIMIITANDQIDQGLEAMRLGCVDYLVNPSHKEISSHVKTACDQATKSHLDHYARKKIASDSFNQQVVLKEVALKLYLEQDHPMTSTDLAQVKMLSSLKTTEPKRSTVLVIDDELMQIKILSRYLATDYTVLHASSAIEALSILSTQAIDVALLDIRMDGMWGDQFLPILKEKHPEISVIMITAYPETHAAVKALKSGAVEYLNKMTYTQNDLLSAVSRAIKLKDFQGSPTYKSDFERRKDHFKNLVVERKLQNKRVFMKDIYTFFPEFEIANISESFCLLTPELEKNLDGFLVNMRKKVEEEKKKIKSYLVEWATRSYAV